MKKSAFVFFALLALCLPQQSVAQIPRVISYQGVLYRDGKLLQGNAPLVFKLYRGNQTGWTSLPQIVLVNNGMFRILLGPFPQEFTFDGIDSLGVTFDGRELSPRVALSAAPFSINSSHSILADSAKNPGPPGLKGDKGDIGLAGATGAASTIAGPTGPAGATGAASTIAGPTGPTGPTGAASTIAGPKGHTGQTGAA